MRLTRKTYWYVNGADDKVLHEVSACPTDNSGADRRHVLRVTKQTAQKMIRPARGRGYRLCKRCQGTK